MDGIHDPRPSQVEGSSSSPESWARRLQRGEVGAVQEVRKRVAKILLYGRLAIPVQEREDLEQEVMTEIWQAVNRSRFDVSAGFWGFVEVVTSRRCIDWLRVQRERLPLPGDIEIRRPGPLRTALARERAALASRVLAALDPRCQDLIRLRWQDDLSYAEIGRSVGKSEGALRVQLYRCIRQARKLWERIDEGSEPGTGIGDRPS